MHWFASYCNWFCCIEFPYKAILYLVGGHIGPTYSRYSCTCSCICNRYSTYSCTHSWTICEKHCASECAACASPLSFCAFFCNRKLFGQHMQSMASLLQLQHTMLKRGNLSLFLPTYPPKCALHSGSRWGCTRDKQRIQMHDEGVAYNTTQCDAMQMQNAKCSATKIKCNCDALHHEWRAKHLCNW